MTHVLHPHMLLHGSGSDAHNVLRRGDFMLVWIDLPSQRTLDTHRASAVRRWGLVKQIIETAIRTLTPAVVYGPAGNRWNIDALTSLQHEGRLTPALTYTIGATLTYDSTWGTTCQVHARAAR